MFKLLKIGKIVGNLYYGDNNHRQDTIVVYGIGAPIPPDNGTLPDAKIILGYKTDIFVPDYIGYGRSEGIFTPENCIKTFLDLYKAFSSGCTTHNYYENRTLKLKYKRIIFIGRSFGGTYIPLLPRFNKNIRELAIFCPVVDSKSCGSVPGEESNEDFLRSMRGDGYHHLYRGIMAKKWRDHLENMDDLSPMNNIRYLKNAKLFIAHGKKDRCVHYSKSEKYYKKIQSELPDKKLSFKLKLYKDGEHGSTTTNPAVEDFFKWIQI